MTFSVQQVIDEIGMQHAMTIRQAVFVTEQNVPLSIEQDTYDTSPETQHFVAYDNISGQAVGAARMRPYQNGVGKVERVAVLSQLRGNKIGQLIMKQLEETAKKNGYQELRLNAQMHAHGFYEQLGYSTMGDTFLEANIEHIAMTRRI